MSAMCLATKGTARGAGVAQGVPGAKKIVSRVLPSFSRRLAAMLSAGMPILSCLTSMRNSMKNPGFRDVLEHIKRKIENGSSFSDALRPFPCIFDQIYVSMIQCGEQSGRLAETIGRLAGYLESSAKFRHKVRSAMTYPIVVLSIALMITCGLIMFIVPVFAGMFADFKADLPGPTQFLVGISGILRHYGVAIVPGVAGGVACFRKWKTTPSGRYCLDRFALGCPILGDLSRGIIATRFSGTFGSLIRSGVPILTALEIAGRATGSPVAIQLIARARVRVEAGEPLSSALAGQEVFPGMLVEMLQAGEHTGKIDEMMDCVADFFEDEVNTTLNGLAALLEPVLMVVLGLIVGGIVVSMFLPVFRLPGLLH